MAEGTDTKTKILTLAENLLQKHGFHGFSYRHLAEALGIKTAAVHYHFRTKETLGIKIVALAREKFRAWAAKTDSEFVNPRARLDAFFAMHADWLNSNIMPPFTALETEFATLPESMKNEVRLLAAETHHWVVGTLQQGQASGDFSFPGDPDTQALLVGSAVQGALLVAQTLGSELYWVAINQIKQQMDPKR